MKAGPMRAGKALDEKRLVDPELLDILVCPITRSRLVLDIEAEELISERAGLAYPIRDGIPVLLVEEARKL